MYTLSPKARFSSSVGNGLFNSASLDLHFAKTKSLVDATTGSNLVDFTRASSGTYVGSDGLIKTAVTNLLLQSEDFSTTWTLGGNTTVTSNYGTAPNGTQTADRVEMPNDFGTVVTQSVTTVPGLTYVFSVYARATSGSSPLTLVLGTVNQQFSLTESWQRYSISFTATGASTDAQLDNGSSAIDVLVWGAQLEQSSTVGEYVKTTSTINSAPRFDHDPTTGESLGLLVEESRTNLLTDSEDLSDASFSLQHITVPFNSSVINPTGSTGSYKILADSGSSNSQGIRINNGASSVNNIVVSAFVKKSTHRYVYIGFGGISNSFTALFDIEPGLTSNRLLGQGGTGTHTNIDAGYQNFSNDWIRIWAVGTTSGGDGTTLGMGPDAATFNITNWMAAGTEEIYAWGLQYEDNVSFPTSYIPTEGSTVTRAADVATDTSTGVNIRTLYAQLRSPASGTRPIASLDDDTANERIELLTSGADPKLLVTDGGSAVADIDAGAVVAGTSAKLATRFATDDYAAVVNGGTPQTDTAGTLPTVDRLRVGSDQAGNYFSGTIARLTGWNVALSDSTLQAITG